MEKVPLVEKNPELKFEHLAPDVWEALGELKRTGWVKRGVKNPESVQEHTIALRDIANSLVGLTDIEKQELFDMLEIHDWPEAISGDQLTISQDEIEVEKMKIKKFEEEKQALASICEKLGEKGKEIMDLWLRFETSPDDTASFARQIDKYQAIEKALEYEKTQGIFMFREFLEYDRKRITHPILLEKIKKLEEKFKNI